MCNKGTGVSVLGVLPVGTGNISALYTVDNQNEQLISIPQVESSKTDKVFFDSGLLDSGDHSINIDRSFLSAQETEYRFAHPGQLQEEHRRSLGWGSTPYGRTWLTPHLRSLYQFGTVRSL